MYKIVKDKHGDYIYNIYKQYWWRGEKFIGYFVAPNKEMTDIELMAEAIKISHPRTVFYEA